jgi:hypothetical protein
MRADRRVAELWRLAAESIPALDMSFALALSFDRLFIFVSGDRLFARALKSGSIGLSE